MANAGFFLGGLSDTLNQGLSRNQQAQFQQQELQVQQQGQQMAQKRFEMAQMDKLLSDVGDHLLQTIDAGKVAGEDPKKISAAIGPMVDQYRKLSTAAGRPPDLVDAQINAAFAAPPSTQTEHAHAMAKLDPMRQQLEQSEINKNNAAADPFGLNGAGNPFQTGEKLGASSTQELPPGAPLPIGGNKQASAAPTPVTGSGQGEKGDAFLATLPPQTAQAVKAVGDYDMDPTSLLSRGTLQARAQFLSLVKEYNPDFDVKEYKARAGAVMDFSKGPTARSIQSFNTLTTHLDLLGQMVTALGNGNNKAPNAIKNAWQEQTGQTMPTDFEGVKTIVGDELVKAILGSGGALGDREAAQKSLDRANSPAQLNSLIDKYQKLAGGQLEGFRKRYESTTGRKDFDRYLLPSAKRQFQTGGDQGSGGSAPKMPAPPPGFVIQ